MRHLDLFSGIGAFALAGRRTFEDYINVGHSEVDEFACTVYHHYFHSPCMGDVRRLRLSNGIVDTITAGFPCPAFSAAGKKGGFLQDELFFEVVRLTKETRPKVCIIENVEGFKPYAKEAGDAFKNLDYGYSDAIFDARDFGVPQSRRRYFGIAVRRDLLGSQHLRGIQGGESADLFRMVADTKDTKGGRTHPVKTKDEWRTIFADSRRVRSDNGIPGRMDRLRVLGNSVVPQVAEAIFKGLRGILE